MSLGFTPSIIIESTLKVGVIYKFEAAELIETSDPHYFIIVGIENDENYMVLCTTQRDAKIEHLRRMRYDLNTLAFIRPNSENGLKMDTYVNCNDYHTISKADLIKKVVSNNLKLTGNLTIEEYDILKKSIELSYVNDIPRYLLVYPQD